MFARLCPWLVASVYTLQIDNFCLNAKLVAMESTSVSHNLRRFRDAQGLSQADLAERAKLSRVAYGNIESGTAVPKVETLLRISDVLGVKLQDLIAPVRTLKTVRFRALKRMTSREQVLLEVSKWLEGYAEVEQLVGERVAFGFDDVAKQVAKKRPGADRARLAAKLARETLDLSDDDSIRDICGLLEERGGIKVYGLRLASDAFFGLSVHKSDGGPAIAVNVWDRISVERWIFTAAHELGHLLLHLSAYKVEEIAENADEEREADQFASYFLMPEEAFKHEWDEARGLALVERVIKVKHIFKVSYKTVLYRLSEDTTYGKAIWGQFNSVYKRQRGHSLDKTAEPERLTPKHFQASMVEPRAADEPQRLSEVEFVEDRLSKLVRAALDAEAISLGRAAEILDLDLKSMRDRIVSWVE